MKPKLRLNPYKPSKVLTLEEFSHTPLPEKSSLGEMSSKSNEIYYANKLLSELFSQNVSVLPLYERLVQRGGWVGECANAGILYLTEGYSSVAKELENVDSKYDRQALFRVLYDRNNNDYVELLFTLLVDSDEKIRNFAASEIIYGKLSKKILKEHIDVLAKYLILPCTEMIISRIDKYSIIKLLGEIASPNDLYVVETLENIAKYGYRPFNLWLWFCGFFTFNFFENGKKEAKLALKEIKQQDKK